MIKNDEKCVAERRIFLFKCRLKADVAVNFSQSNETSRTGTGQ